MMHKLTLRTMLLSSVCLAPLSALAADLGAAPAAPVSPTLVSDNEVTFGLGGLFGKNTGQYGRYNGFTEEGLDGLFGFKSDTQSTWDSGGTRYYQFWGDRLDYQFGNNLGTANYPIDPTGTAIVNGQITGFKDNNYVSKTANDLGPDASLGFSIGDQGHWGITGGYNAISYTGNIIDSIYTVSGNHGALNSPLTTWGGATPTSQGFVTGYDAINNGTPPTCSTTAPCSTGAFPLGALQPVQNGTRRDIVAFTGKYLWNDWTITGAVRAEHKEGSMEESFDGNKGGEAFALPVDYNTDRYDLSASYATPQLQAQLAYFLSHFTDNNNGVYLPNFVSGAACSPALTCKQATPFAQTALYATPPSNWAQYWTAMVGYNVLPQTRINVNARYGLEMQDDTFPANTGDPGITFPTVGGGPVTLGGPPGGFTVLNSLGQGTGSATSLGAVAQVFQGNAAISSTPITNLNTNLSYGLDWRHVTINSFNQSAAGCNAVAPWNAGASNCVFGSGSGSDSSISGVAGYVVPQDWTKQKVKADADYRILPQSDTKLLLGVEYDAVDRSNAQVNSSHTLTETVGLSSVLNPAWVGRINYEHDDRSGVMQYWEAWSNLEGKFDDETLSGAYYQAPMTADGITLRTDYSPGTAFSGGLQFKARDEHFHYPSGSSACAYETTCDTENLANQVYGITQDYNLTVGIDGNYRVSDALNFHAYYTYEEIFYNNVGNGECADSTGVPSAGNLCTGSAGYFVNKSTDGVHTLGLDAEWKATDKLKFGLDYTFSYGAVMFGEYNGVVVATPTQTYQNVTNYPDINTVMNSLTLKAHYQLAANTELLLGATWSMLRMDNFNDLPPALVASAPTTTGGVTTAGIDIFTPGYSSPNYNVGMLMAAVKVKW